jgi:hypothetical protein
MRSRTLAALVVACLATFALAGCGDDSADGSGGDSTKELASTPGSGDSGSDSGSSDDTLPDLSDLTIPEDLSDMSIPDMSDFGDLGDCMTQATAYASIALSALGGDNSGVSAENALAEMKSSLPDDLKDDIEVVANAYRTVAEEGFIEGGEAMDTPEFEEADAAISKYFEDTCGG